MDEELMPWERQPDENVSGYKKFCAYRDMAYASPDDPGEIPRPDITRRRSLRKLAKELGRKLMTLSELSTRFRWQERCEAYDLYILERLRAANENAILEMRARHADAGAKLVERGVTRLASLSDEAITPDAAARMIDVGVKIERLSRGSDTAGGAASEAGTDIGADVRNAVEEAVGKYANVGAGKDNSMDVKSPG